jgi:hypothetical protein
MWSADLGVFLRFQPIDASHANARRRKKLIKAVRLSKNV